MIGKAEDPIIKRSIGRKQTKIVYTKDGSDKRTKTLLTPDADAGRPCFSDEGEFLGLRAMIITLTDKVYHHFTTDYNGLRQMQKQ